MTGRFALLATALAYAVPVTAQGHGAHHMPGMAMPPSRPVPARPVVRKPAARAPAQPPRARRAPASAAPAAPHAGHQDMPSAAAAAPADEPRAAPPAPEPVAPAGTALPAAPAGTALPAGNEPRPFPPADHWADREFAPAEMARARARMMAEQGAQTFTLVMLNIAEIQPRRGGDAYRWDGEAWFGGDIHRLTIKSESEGRSGRRLGEAEVQALYSRAIDPYFNLQAGVRHDFRPTPGRTYAVLGVEGLAPYWFEVEAAAFLSDRGDLLGRFEGYYDQRVTQRLVLQPRAELNLSAQDVAERGIGRGIVDAELGLRLRYEITRQLAPYIGVSWERKLGRTADLARAGGDDPGSARAAIGVRLWF